MSASSRIEEYVQSIVALGTTFDRLSRPFRTETDPQLEDEPDTLSADYWRRNAYGNALIRLRLFAENNFQFVETIGLLAVARYVFELSVWLRLFERDARYCLIYYRELLGTQLRYYEDTVTQLQREVQLLRQFEELDNPTFPAAVGNDGELQSAADFGSAIRAAMNRVDAEASRHFLLYLDDAQVNGYGFQAHLVEKRVIPPVQGAVAELEKTRADFEVRAPENVRTFAKGKWNWRERSKEAGIAHEHDYIYAYASKLLHATPASLTTNQKHLEGSEIILFLRYIYVKMLEIIDLAHAQPECRLHAQ